MDQRPFQFSYRDINRSAPVPTLDWNDERIELLKKLWATGASASVISKQMPGTTRNSIIGKVRRLGLPFRIPTCRIPHPPRPKREAKPTVKRVKNRFVFSDKLKVDKAPMAPLPLPPQQVEDIARVLSVIALEPHHCRWPVGEPLQGFCGCNKVPGTSYCEHHAARAFKPARVEPRAYPTANIGMRALKAAEEFVA